jgi:hypothetical protein
MSNPTKVVVKKKIIRVKQLSGIYAYTFQSFVHAQDIDTQIFHGPLWDQVGNGLDPSDPLHNPPMNPSTAPKAELLVMTAFYPRLNPLVNPAPSPFLPQATIPHEPSYVPDAGYYPFSEAGWMEFDGAGNVKGKIRINLAGFACDGGEVDIDGGYKFLNYIIGGNYPIPAGTITVKWPAMWGGHVWDYSFFVVSAEEIQLMALGRRHHPAVGTGTLKRLKWNEITY